MAIQPPDYMDRIVEEMYAPLLLPHPLNALPGGDYKKYLPRFNGQGEVTIEEHWNPFFNYVDNQNIEAKDVWMGMFIQILDGEAKKMVQRITCRFHRWDRSIRRGVYATMGEH